MNQVSVAVVVQVPIHSVVIGQRRREKLGRLQSLANSIKAHGLIHPILLMGDTLIAGHRRLEACRSLNWKTIPARRIDKMTDEQLRAVELDENVAREALSDFATSKTRLAQIRQAEADLKAKTKAEAEEFRSTLKRNSKRGRTDEGRPPKADSKRAVAAETGISLAEQVRTERHVTLAEQYPFLQRAGWRRHDVLEAGVALAKIPEAERGPIAVLLDQPGIPVREAIGYLTNAAAMPKPQRQAIVAQSQSADEFERRTALTSLAQVPPPPDPGLLALNDAVEDLKRAATSCRSALYKRKVGALSAGAQKLRDAFRAHERQERTK
jgi:ParB family chromosome partitioning protein